MEGNLEDAFAGEVTRRDFLRRTAAAGVGLSALSGLRVASALGAAAATQTVR
jgi:hypothetical protein